jgi:uncharacterized protein (DUF1800 family)
VAPAALSQQDQRALLGSLKAMGQELFLPPSVGGWPSGQGWLATSAAQARLAFAQQLARLADLSTVEGASRESTVDAVAHLLSVPQWSDRTRRVLAEVGDPAQLVALALASPEYAVG